MIKLRPLEHSDEALLVKYLNNPSVVAYLSSKIPQPYTAKDAHWWVTQGSKENAIVQAIDYQGTFCGVIGVYTQNFEYAHSAEIGYWIAEEYWGKGIATKAVSLFSNQLFLQHDLMRLYAPVFSANDASKRVLTKAGFELEGIFKKALVKRGKYFDEYRFARLSPHLNNIN